MPTHALDTWLAARHSGRLTTHLDLGDLVLVLWRGQRQVKRVIPFLTISRSPIPWRDIVAFELRWMRQQLRRGK